MLSIATFIAFLALAMLGLPIAHALIVGAQLGLMPSERLGSEFIVSQLVTQTQSFPLIAIPFFMLTGFHGFHVTVGTIMLWVILFRSVAGHFTPEHHFGFEGVAWYWHFVDVVWVLLFVLVYIL